MDPISNVDQLVLLLRQRLQERAKTARRGEPLRTASRPAQPLAALSGLDERQFRRALIQNLLAERLGRHLLNEAGFQQVIDQVVDALESDDLASQTLSRVVADLRAASS